MYTTGQAIPTTETQKFLNFDTIRNTIAHEHDRNNDDLVIDLSDMKITDDLDIDLPDVGPARLSDTAKTQLGSILGVKWDKWFAQDLVDPETVREELSRRLSSHMYRNRVRTRKYSASQKKELGSDSPDSYIRSFLSPSYHVIDNDRVFSVMADSVKGQLDSYRFIPAYGAGRSWVSNTVDFYTLVDLEHNVDLGKSPDDAGIATQETALAKEGKETTDIVYHGLQIKNSEVGYSSLTIDEFNYRLVCLNGMVLRTSGSALLKRQHREVADSEIGAGLSRAFTDAPERWVAAQKHTVKAIATPVIDPPAYIDTGVRRFGGTKAFVKEAQAAYEHEPSPTHFGAVQAVTRAAQGIQNVVRRVEYETLAGRLLAAA